MNPLTETDAGIVGGLDLGGCHAYLGVPYAAPPVGPLRFAAPVAAAPWAGARDATRFGSAAPQLTAEGAGGAPPTLARGLASLLYPFSGSPVGNVTVDEDCLFVNVWTPIGSGEPRPVMVWLHGGAFLHGPAQNRRSGETGWPHDTMSSSSR
ncbi:carboxylesterase family protein [Microbacterium sp. NIBRBAC000506063]|uniref:carboxylesterase family protein n=1 Tax=Microbacterium sp. NIBRBAC000506063 TaxID=2734618 RepID=UPI001BB778B8|nr:carboxylesterase family protein [Microbacterium sp. NIBRBAC000506063]QTV79109.1 carboxylesterase family protein [Microbacterium sp. NIBRBAC000506063]